MNLEDNLFKNDYHYRSGLINRCIAIIQTSDDVRRVQALKMFVFKAMKDVVRKNITNYLNLLNGMEHPPLEMPVRDALVADCYTIYDKCVSNYNLQYDSDKSSNFYFFFNKSLARCFYKEYRRAYTHNHLGITDAILNANQSLRHDAEESVDTLVSLLGFSDREVLIINSRLSGQRTVDFLDENPDISETEYSRCLKSIKNVLRQAYKNKDIDFHYDIKELKKLDNES